jgi:DeoR/GlpR family transcriptional regulator of sugar metabolism
VLAEQRRSVILDEVRRTGAVRVSDLVRALGVSDMTVRRDLDDLARRGLVDKVHGGATMPREPSTREPGFAAKAVREQAEKEAIAAEAVRLVEPGMAVGLSAGTTTWAMARHLRDVPGLTVVTNSTRVADVLHETPVPDRTLVLTGGIRTPSDALVGPLAVAALRTLHLDLVFMGVHGMDERAGFTTPNLMEAETDRALVESARELVVVADHTKWRVVGISTIAPLDAAHTLVVDTGLPDDARATLAEHVGALTVARPGAEVASELAAEAAAGPGSPEPSVGAAE